MIGWPQRDPDERLDRAAALFHEGRVDEARTELKELADQGYCCAEVYLYLGHCALAFDRLGEALGHYRETRRRDPDRADVLVGLAIVAARRLHFERAIRLLVRATGSEPGLQEAWDNLILCYAAVGNQVAAEEAFRKSVAIDDASPHAYYNAGYFYFDAGKATEAREMWRIVRRLQRDYPDVERLLATCDRVLGDVDAAKRRLERLLRGEPRNTDALAELALVHEARDEWQSAVKACERALDADPRRAQVRARLGVLLFRNANKKDGLAHLGRAHAEDGTDPAIAEPYALALVDSGRALEAFAVVRQLVRSPEDAGDTYAVRAHVYAAARRYVRAAAAARRAWRCRPKEASHGHEMALALGRAGRTESARSVLAEMLATDLGGARTCEMLVDLELHFGDIAVARSTAERGLSNHPDSSGLRLRSAEIALRLGDPERALRFTRWADVVATGADPLAGDERGRLIRVAQLDVSGRALLDLGEYEQAAGVAEQLLAADADDPRGLALRGRSALRSGDLERALPDLRGYVRARPDDPTAYRDLAACLDRMGQGEAAAIQTRLGEYVRRETVPGGGVPNRHEPGDARAPNEQAEPAGSSEEASA